MPFKSFLKRVNTTLPSQSLKDASFSLKTNKSPGADKINFNVIKHCFEELCGPFTLHISFITTKWDISRLTENHYSITCI